jgi:hypothetical protein
LKLINILFITIIITKDEKGNQTMGGGGAGLVAKLRETLDTLEIHPSAPQGVSGPQVVTTALTSSLTQENTSKFFVSPTKIERKVLKFILQILNMKYTFILLASKIQFTIQSKFRSPENPIRNEL